MPVIREMEEFYLLEEQVQADLLPDEFAEDPETYVLRYGNIYYLSFINTVIAFEDCLVTLTDGSKLRYENQRTIYKPNPWAKN